MPRITAATTTTCSVVSEDLLINSSIDYQNVYEKISRSFLTKLSGMFELLDCIELGEHRGTSHITGR